MLTSVQQTLTIVIVTGNVLIAMVLFLAPVTQALVEMDYYVQVTINSLCFSKIMQSYRKQVNNVIL